MNFYSSITNAVKRERETIVQIDDDEKKQYHEVNFDGGKLNLLHIFICSNSNCHLKVLYNCFSFDNSTMHAWHWQRTELKVNVR
jgi:hypothetical protein